MVEYFDIVSVQNYQNNINKDFNSTETEIEINLVRNLFDNYLKINHDI